MTKIIANLRTALSNRRAYTCAIAEIQQLDARELADMNIDRDTLMAGVHRQVYGAAR